MENHPNDIETLRLVAAFFNVTDPQARRMILAIVEATADGTSLSEALRLLPDELKPR